MKKSRLCVFPTESLDNRDASILFLDQRLGPSWGLHAFRGQDSHEGLMSPGPKSRSFVRALWVLYQRLGPSWGFYESRTNMLSTQLAAPPDTHYHGTSANKDKIVFVPRSWWSATMMYNLNVSVFYGAHTVKHEDYFAWLFLLSSKTCRLWP